MVERLIRTIKEQCVHRCYRHRFESLQHANRVLSDWIQFYNEVRPHQALDMKTSAEAYAEVPEMQAAARQIINRLKQDNDQFTSLMKSIGESIEM